MLLLHNTVLDLFTLHKGEYHKNDYTASQTYDRANQPSSQHATVAAIFFPTSSKNNPNNTHQK